ncbi:hypothetical protein HYD75_03575 [Mycoplasmopsis bovis]|nr:hypothetical protein [Mycoplasmopsis bovis]QQH49007.1 hypothetical protein HYD75_03575 [Mycoplasmopsis bovis]
MMNLDLEAGKNDNDNTDSRTKVILPEMPKNDKEVRTSTIKSQLKMEAKVKMMAITQAIMINLYTIAIKVTKLSKTAIQKRKLISHPQIKKNERMREKNN